MKANAGSVLVASVYSSHLACLFPQVGGGKKHERRISLEPWQRNLVELAPWGLIRGLIHSDGCAFINRTGRYEYLSYHFANKSADIIELFTQACSRVRVEYRVTHWRGLFNVRINRRRSVEIMLQE